MKHKSGAENQIEKILEGLDPASERYRVLEVAKRFKSSWVELGEQLAQVREKNLYHPWGYDSFEDYCTQEVHIRKQTALKLTAAYLFMKKEEPQIAQEQVEFKPLPDYRSIDLLRQAKQEKDFSDNQYAQLRASVLENGLSFPTVRKQFNEIAQTMDETAPCPLRQSKTALSAARRLLTSLEAAEAPEDYTRSTLDLIAYLESRIEELAETDSSET